VIFGARWEEDENGECVINGTPVLGNSVVRLQFINPEPGAPMPDLIQLLFFPEEGQVVEGISIDSEAFQELPDGTVLRAATRQLAMLKDGQLRFLVEKVIVERVKKP
jgi:hypothetical protein